MFVTLLQFRHFFAEHGHLYLFAIFSAIVWAMWALKSLLSRRYRPWTREYHTSTSVIIPVVDEPPGLFRDVLARICQQQPTETIVVINGPRNQVLETICDDFADQGVRWTWTAVAGKRNAVRVGTQMASGQILVLVDSDTVWTRGTLTELVKPFADPKVGGVTTRQRILHPNRHFLLRWADWLENSRAKYSMPAQSALGYVGCLPGRTIAFRKHIVEKAMPHFMHGRFLGVFLEVSDDRTLTNETLKQGYKSVYQSTSLVYTDAPTKWKKLYKQQLRWARGSQYNTLRMLPFMLRHTPVLALFYLVDIILPFLLIGAIIGGVRRALDGSGVNYYMGFIEKYGMGLGAVWVIVLSLLATGLSMSIRHLRHLEEVPSDIIRMPIFVLIATFFLMPIRMIGFFRMGHVAGWGTRADAYAGGGDDDLMKELEQLPPTAPTDIIDRHVESGDTVDLHQAGAQFTGQPGGSPARPAGQPGAVATLERPEVAALAPAVGAPAVDDPSRTQAHAPTRTHSWRNPNPWAGIPYFIGFAILIAEIIYRG